MQLNPRIDELCQKHQLEAWSHVNLDSTQSLKIYREWLEQDHHASMQYLKEHLSAKENPDQLLPQALSALVFTQNYVPHPEPKTNPAPHAKVALYAKGRDYHFWFKEKMQRLIEDLKILYPNEQFIAFTDSAPILERDLAYRGSLGWFGKNSCLIHPQKGSFFHIGEILTTLKKTDPPSAHIHDFCGHCRRCIEACPTQAILENKTIKSDRCISYWTIESKTAPPVSMRSFFGDWLFGCDVCQTVCPWNEKQFKNELWFQKQKKQTEVSSLLIQELRDLLRMSGKQFQKKFKDSPFLRAGHVGLKRNVIIVATNLKIAELKNDIAQFKAHEKLAELTEWSLNILSSIPKA